MTFHHLRAPRPAAAPPAARQPGPVTMALRAMRQAITAPPASGPVTAAIRTMRAADPAVDRNPDLIALRRALADRIEADIAALDMLGGDPDLEDGADTEPSLGSTESHYFNGTVWSGINDGRDREEENEHGGDINDELHDPEEDMGADEDGDFSRHVQFSGYNYHPLRAR